MPVSRKLASQLRSKANPAVPTMIIAKAIGTLPERQKRALVLRHFEGWSNPEIGQELECSVEAVESLLARARRQLANLMKEEREGHSRPKEESKRECERKSPLPWRQGLHCGAFLALGFHLLKGHEQLRQWGWHNQRHGCPTAWHKRRFVYSVVSLF